MPENKASAIAGALFIQSENQIVMINIIVFELTNGSRVELAIKDPNTYGVMVEGDHGTLKYQGKKYVGFERDNSNEMQKMVFHSVIASKSHQIFTLLMCVIPALVL